MKAMGVFHGMGEVLDNAAATGDDSKGEP